MDSCEVGGGFCHSVNCFITKDTAENGLMRRRNAVHKLRFNTLDWGMKNKGPRVELSSDSELVIRS